MNSLVLYSLIQKWKCTQEQKILTSVWHSSLKTVVKRITKTWYYRSRKAQKMSSKKKWTNREYHVQQNKDVEHQDVKIYCATNQFPELKFLCPNNKKHGVRGLGNNYHMRFDTKLWHGTCAVCNTSNPFCVYFVHLYYLPTLGSRFSSTVTTLLSTCPIFHILACVRII